MCGKHGMNTMFIKMVLAFVSVIFYKATQAIAVTEGVIGLWLIIFSHRLACARLPSMRTCGMLL